MRKRKKKKDYRKSVRKENTQKKRQLRDGQRKGAVGEADRR